MNQNLSIGVCSGGWNARDPLDAMPITDAIIYDNVIHVNGRDTVRKGYEKIVNTGANMIFAHNQMGAKRLLAIKDNQLTSYDLSGVQKFTKQLASVVAYHGIFIDGAGKVYSVIADGSSKPKAFTTDGIDDSFEEMGFENTEPLIFPFAYKNRLWFIKQDSFDLYYGDVQSIAGTLTKFGVGSFFKKGGKIIALASWTQDGGNGPDDQLCIFTDAGEVLVYSGTSPEAEDWRLVGRYEIPEPINYKTIMQVKGDVIVGTVAGYMPLSSVLSEFSAQKVAVSNKIVNAILDKNFADNNWNCIYYSGQDRLIFNAPSSELGVSYEWHVLNLQNQTWSRFLGQDSLDFCCFGQEMFFCRNDGIYKDNSGTTDNGYAIKARIQHAYSDYGIKQKKKFNRINMRDVSSSIDEFYKFVWVDYNETLKTFLYNSSKNNEDLAKWDTSKWDEAKWTDVSPLTLAKAGIAHIPGIYISIGFWLSTKAETSLLGADIMAVSGNGGL